MVQVLGWLACGALALVQTAQALALLLPGGRPAGGAAGSRRGAVSALSATAEPKPFAPTPSTSPSQHPPYSAEWARERGLEPGYGGIWPGNPDAKKYTVTLRSKKEPGKEYTLQVPADRYIYFYFEQMGIDLPVVNKARMCRQGCCTICTAKIINDEGKVKMDAPLGLLKEFREKRYALTCCALPRSDLVCELQDEDETYVKQWSEGFEGGGVEWGGFLPDDD